MQGPARANTLCIQPASILTAAYFILRDQVDYQDLGGNYFTRHNRDKLVRQLARRIETLGYEVQVRPAA